VNSLALSRHSKQPPSWSIGPARWR